MDIYKKLFNNERFIVRWEHHLLSTKNITEIQCRKWGISLSKSKTRVMSSCLEVVLIVTNKYVKFQSNSARVYEISGMVQKTLQKGA